MTIVNAKDKPLSMQSNALPNVSGAMAGLFQDMTFGIMQKQVIGATGLVQEIEVKVTTRGVRQPLSAQALAIKPKGQRAWKWEMIHCLPDVVLVPDDRIKVAGSIYRVMDKFNYSEYGYVRYDIAQDYKDCGVQ